MRRLLVLALVLGACTTTSGDTTTSTGIDTTTSTTTADTATTTTIPPDCPAAPYELNSLPFGVGEGELDVDSLDPDVWTSVAGTNTTFLPRSDDTVAIALIRGTLPPVEWPTEKGSVSIDGTDAVAGPHPDGKWVVGWFEQPAEERCNQYTMVFYPPWNPEDVETTLLGMNRVGG